MTLRWLVSWYIVLYFWMSTIYSQKEIVVTCITVPLLYSRVMLNLMPPPPLSLPASVTQPTFHWTTDLILGSIFHPKKGDSHTAVKTNMSFASRSRFDYRIYSSEHPGRSFNFEFSKGGPYSREALFRGRRSLIYQGDIKILSTCLLNQTIRTVIITEE